LSEEFRGEHRGATKYVWSLQKKKKSRKKTEWEEGRF